MDTPHPVDVARRRIDADVAASPFIADAEANLIAARRRYEEAFVARQAATSRQHSTIPVGANPAHTADYLRANHALRAAKAEVDIATANVALVRESLHRDAWEHEVAVLDGVAADTEREPVEAAQGA